MFDCHNIFQPKTGMNKSELIERLGKDIPFGMTPKTLPPPKK